MLINGMPLELALNEDTQAIFLTISEVIPKYAPYMYKIKVICLV